MVQETFESQTAMEIELRKTRNAQRISHQVALRSMKGPKRGSVELDPELFGVTPNMAVLHQVVQAQMAGARSGTQSTLTRAQVRGGGRKPWRQKGTGRARQGSIRSPQWVGGGVALGPKPRDYSQDTPKKMVRLALASALSDRANSKRVVVITGWEFEKPSTKAALAFLKAFKLRGNVLIVLGGGDGDSEADFVAYKSFANLPNVGLVPAGELTAWDVLRSDWLVFTTESLPGNTTTQLSTPQVTAEPAELVELANADAPQVTAEPAELVELANADAPQVTDEPADTDATPITDAEASEEN